MAKEDSSS
ncbi:hypothetical protein RDI58_014468 [Solanum bulbocastanum]|uniref:Uncharacterized protein n=1 Tax=Solanum bulbocastanum TaxID=147425 RepID=A0AAN8TCD0_SOLBU